MFFWVAGGSLGMGGGIKHFSLLWLVGNGEMEKGIETATLFWVWGGMNLRISSESIR